MATAVVIGGGVSGLSAAYYIQRYLPHFKKVIVLESSSRLGGWVHSTVYPDGAIFEHGPRSIRPNGEQGRNTLQMVEELGLAAEVLPVLKSSPAAKNRFLFANDKLCALPNSVSGLVRTIPPFSKPLALMGALEPLRRRSSLPDESIHAFVSRRLGTEVADYAIDAMCRGIFAGDCRQLSVESCMPPLHKMEKDYGSLLLGALLGPKEKEDNLAGLSKRSREEGWASWSLNGGMQALTDRLGQAVGNTPGGELCTNTAVTRVARSQQSGKLDVMTESDSIPADLVVSSIYSKDLSPLLPAELSPLKELLAQLESVNVVVVNLEYNGDVLPVKGFGHLLPSQQGGPMLGVVYDSCTFPQHNRRASADSTRLTVMMGGAWYNDLLTSDGTLPSGGELVWKAREAVSKHLGVNEHPVRSHVSLQENCIPQYKVGHSSWLSSLEGLLEKSGLPLILTGASYRGPAVNDCINNTKKSIQALAKTV